MFMADQLFMAGVGTAMVFALVMWGRLDTILEPKTASRRGWDRYLLRPCRILFRLFFGGKIALETDGGLIWTARALFVIAVLLFLTSAGLRVAPCWAATGRFGECTGF
jgi:hypothetical protein